MSLKSSWIFFTQTCGHPVVSVAYVNCCVSLYITRRMWREARYTLATKVELNTIDFVESQLLPKPTTNRQQRRLSPYTVDFVAGFGNKSATTWIRQSTLSPTWSTLSPECWTFFQRCRQCLPGLSLHIMVFVFDAHLSCNIFVVLLFTYSCHFCAFRSSLYDNLCVIIKT